MRFVACLSTLCIAACTILPRLDEATGGIPVREIVLRIKCELSDAFESADHRTQLLKNPKFAWLKSWTAQVDLTLEILNSATLAPGVTFNKPLHNAYDPAVGPTSLGGSTIAAIPQSFAVNAGASLNGQAQRTETMSFAISLAELERWRESEKTADMCKMSDNMDIRGRLGLKEWISEALSPVARENEDVPQYLWAGYHPKPTTTAAASPKATSPAQPGRQQPKAARPRDCSEDSYVANLKGATATVNQASANLQTSADTVEKAKADIKSSQTTLNKFDVAVKAFADFKKKNANFESILDPDIKNTLEVSSRLVARTKGIYAAITKDLNDATGLLAKYGIDTTSTTGELSLTKKLISSAARDKPQTACDAAAQADSALERSTDAIQTATQIRANVGAAQADIKQLKPFAEAIEGNAATLRVVDPPISNIGQSVQFVLVYDGNVTPTWTFVSFKGPSSPLFNAQGTRTHMLSITIGPTQPGTTSTPTQQVLTNQNNLLLNNLLPSIQR